MTGPRIAVVARSFCGNAPLVAELSARYPNLTLNPHARTLKGDELVSVLAGCTHAITGLETIDAAVLARVPELRHISKYGVGLDTIDLAALDRAGVTLGWTPGVNRLAVAELTLTFLLTLIRSVHLSEGYAAAGEWKRPRGRELSGKTVGIIGCGNVGQTLIALLRPFRCRILAHDIRDRSAFYAENGVVRREFGRSPLPLGPCLAPRPEKRDDSASHRSRRTSGNATGRLSREYCPGRHYRRVRALCRVGGGGARRELRLTYSKRSHPPTGVAYRDPRIVLTPHVGGGSDEAMLAMGRAAIANLENRNVATTYAEFT